MKKELVKPGLVLIVSSTGQKVATIGNPYKTINDTFFVMTSDGTFDVEDLEVPRVELDFAVRCDVVVTGHDSEFADMTNPTGALYGDAYYVLAESPDGARLAHDHNFINDQEGAEALAVEIILAYSRGADLNLEHWRTVDPCYGSEAYVSGNWDAININREKREDEESRI